MSELLPGLRWKDWSFVPTSVPARRRNELGLNLLLFGYLGFTFAAALLLYLITSARNTGRSSESLPWEFWVSTPAVLCGGVCLRLAVRAVRRERQARARRLVWAAVACGVAFAVLQVRGFASLIDGYHAIPVKTVTIDVGTDVPVRVADPDAVVRTPITGVAGMLVLLHALHFVGGLLVLGVTAVRTLMGRYDHEYFGGLHLAARYWAFLDVSWVILLGVFYVTL